MRRMIWLALAAAGALIVSGLAVAHGGGAKATKSVTATFAAAPSPDNKTRTCQTADGTFEITNGVYRGTATSSDPDLHGAVRIRAHAVINTTKGLGWITGRLIVDVAEGADTGATFRLVYEGGRAHGLATGHAHRPWAALLANLSATYSPTAGFGEGKIGDTAADGSAILLRRGHCRAAR
jgi:hypothetical protein